MHYDDESVFDNADVDNMPVFSESRRFSRLDGYEKMLLRDYIRSCIRKHREYSGRKRIGGNPQTGDKRVGGRMAYHVEKR